MVLYYLSHDYSTPFASPEHKGACHSSLLQYETKIFLFPAFLIISSIGNKLVVLRSPNRQRLNNYTKKFLLFLKHNKTFQTSFSSLSHTTM